MASAAGAKVIEYEYLEQRQFAPDLQKLQPSLKRKPTPRVLVINNPHNPTGQMLDETTLKELLAAARRVGTQVVVDEVFRGIVIESAAVAPSATAFDRKAIVIGSLSKVYGLAGLRVGYGVGASSVVRLIERARGPYKVNTLAERAVLAALAPTADGLGWVREHVALAIENRARLIAELSTMGFVALPSAANFIMVPTPRAAELFRALSSRGVLIRAFTAMPRDLPVLAECNGTALRISVGPWEMMEVLLSALREVMA